MLEDVEAYQDVKRRCGVGECGALDWVDREWAIQTPAFIEHALVHLVSPDIVARVQKMFDQPSLAAADLQDRPSWLQSPGRIEEPEIRLEVAEVVPLLEVVTARPVGSRLAATGALDRAGLVH